jgi:anti-sigma-K factor RskA
LDIQSYIASGILENYVLGITSPEETVEVESVARQYPQVRAEIDAIRASLEAYIMQHEQLPPASLKKRIWNKLEQLDAEEEVRVESNKTKVLTSADNSTNYISYLLAATVAAFVLSLGINFYLYSQLNDTRQRLADANARNQSLTASLQVKESDYAQATAQLNILRNSDYRPVFLAGQKPAPDAAVMVYWNKDQQHLYLAVHNLPPPTPGMQYQLWAIVNGKPVDAGMLELDEQGTQLQRMKDIAEAEAFAVTLENQGGNPAPKGQVCVLGKV